MIEQHWRIQHDIAVAAGSFYSLLSSICSFLTHKIFSSFPALLFFSKNLKLLLQFWLMLHFGRKKLRYLKIDSWFWNLLYPVDESISQIYFLLFLSSQTLYNVFYSHTYTSLPLDGMTRNFFSTWIRKSMQLIMSGSIWFLPPYTRRERKNIWSELELNPGPHASCFTSNHSDH